MQREKGEGRSSSGGSESWQEIRVRRGGAQEGQGRGRVWRGMWQGQAGRWGKRQGEGKGGGVRIRRVEPETRRGVGGGERG
eukprot:978953-Rhodomonas_salina.1